MGIYGGLKPEDWNRWGQFTTLKTNAAELAASSMSAGQVIYCSPLVDPYQPAEQQRPLMPGILQAVSSHPPAVFVIQTRGILILRDLDILRQVAKATILRISFSVTTDRDEIRRRYEPHCEPNEARLTTIRELRKAELEVYATLAPLLPCNPERLAQSALEASERDLIGDPLHVRESKPRGATSRAASLDIARRYGELSWFDPAFQQDIVSRIERVAAIAGREFTIGPRGFGRLAGRRGCSA